ncbi:hypothetical protein GQ42DRAFT_164029 [Ramicandelaber brevisporus]|nr:hypothetical protein GQ42DRAFT_164029 [Ramicandelaber brevisporus]
MTPPPNYSLWLSPVTSDPAHAAIQGIISSNSARLDTPAFGPHLTLLGSFPLEPDTMLALTNQLASELRAGGHNGIYIHPADVATGSKFYQSVMFQVDGAAQSGVNGAAKLVDVHAAACRVFGRLVPSEDGTSQVPCFFYPHVSLIYSDSTQAERSAYRQSILDDIAAAGRSVSDHSYIAHSIKIVRTDLHPSQWTTLGDIAI